MVLMMLFSLLAGFSIWFVLGLVPQVHRLSQRDRWTCLVSLPEFFELMAMILSSGATVHAAWSRALAFMPASLLRDEIERITHLMQAGLPAEQAIMELSQRLNDSRCAMYLSLISQSLTRGNALEPILLKQASSIRKLCMIEIERKSQTASLRMMFPIFLFIFPSVLILLLAPVFLKLTQGGFFF